jgi:prepilin-type N-terminal cleavage/methylation domain-containing protein/prepilin-type processing-associated H-X9-DG protein
MNPTSGPQQKKRLTTPEHHETNLLKNPSPMNYVPRKKTLNGFTLIELLTVIAIIGILAAIIIPTVGRVRESAKSSKCVANLRSLATALTLAAQDNRGNLPKAIDTSVPESHENRNWMTYLSNRYELLWRTAPGTSGRRNNEVYNCPSTGRVGEGVWPETSPCYGVNNSLMATNHGGSTTPSKGKSLNAILEPSRLILIADVSGPTGLMSGQIVFNAPNFVNDGFPSNLSSIPVGFPAPRHPSSGTSSYSGGSFNAGFVDGHVERIVATDARLTTVEGRRAMFLGQ